MPHDYDTIEIRENSEKEEIGCVTASGTKEIR